MKNSIETFSWSVVEDGLVIRCSSDTMPQLVKALIEGQDFHLKTPSMSLSIIFDPTNKWPENLQGALVSPIDGINLAVNIFFKFYKFKKMLYF